MLRILALLATTLLALPNAATAWWSPEWEYRKAVTFDTTAAGSNVPSDLKDTAVLLRLHTGNFAHFMDLSEGAADLRVVAGDDKTPLPFHIEKFDPVNELALVWVKVPLIKGNTAPAPGPEAAASPDNKIYLYFGNPKAIAEQSSINTYGASDALVFHFDSVDGVPVNRSATPLPAPQFNGQPVPASLIGSGIRLGVTTSLTVADAGTLAIEPARGWAVSMWLRFEAAQDGAHVFERAIGKQRLAIVLEGTEAKLLYVDTNGTAKESEPAPLAPATWHHLALTTEGGQFALYVDGQEASTLVAPAEPIAGPLVWGATQDRGAGIDAEFDELRVFSAVPDKLSLRFAALTQGVDGKGVVYLADESADQEGAGERSGNPSYFGVILNQVFGNKEAIIEQSVIAICGFMALVAFAVMGLKQRYLMRCQSASKRFLTAYEGLGVGDDADLGALLASDGGFRESPLFRVYRTGMAELRRRVGNTGKRIHGRSLAAIGAAMDATMVREGQRMNAQMVLLTIAISGGPFIGLLGTVVGVMVTFAAIAASGDVNINAIAPGMAAALLATTAGLAVAIPSLFGYNYLGSRVKDLAADMHVFADEFLARVNERYGED